MNGEVGLICRLTAAARKAMKTGEFKFAKLPYENNIKFEFVTSDNVANTPEEWFAKVKEDGATNIFMILPYDMNRKRLGFVNTSGATIFVKRASGKVTRFIGEWIPDNEKRVWNITMHEEIMENPPAEIPSFKNNTAPFATVLKNAEKFAEHIGFNNFASIFKMGADVLGGAEMPEPKFKESLPELPEAKMKLYFAADISDVFGAMGSWNDSPAAKAAEMGISDEYEMVSKELIAHNRLALMYAINED